LPTNFTTNSIHQYGPNACKLHGLPIPRRPGHVLGLLGTNGMGKNKKLTALKILSGCIKPNMGNLDYSPSNWVLIMTHFCGSDLQINYFQRVLMDNRLKMVLSHQAPIGIGFV
jgi:ATP-binding cassette subfamily E protein 1